MQIQSRLFLLHSKSGKQRAILQFKRRMADTHDDRGQGRPNSGGLQRVQDTYLSTQEEVGRGFISRNPDQGSISMGQFMHFFDQVSPMPLHDFAHHRKARAEHLKYRALFTAVARRLGRFSLNQIGKIFNRDHSSILYYSKRHEEMFNEDDAYALIYMDLEENIKKLMDEKYADSNL